MERTIVRTSDAPLSTGPLSQAVRWGHLLFISGQVSRRPESREIVGDSAETQTRQVLTNLRSVVEAAGGNMQLVLKTTCFLTDIGAAEAVNRAYAEFFPTEPPARSMVEVSRLAPGVMVEIEAISAVPE